VAGRPTWEKDTKTHQRRRITLDELTMNLLRMYHRFCTARAAQLGGALAPEARIFSLDPDGATWLKPSSVGQRYERMCGRLGWDMNIHQLRHYSATELIAAGVDIRTVAGRLGHGGGGATTLRVYSAWKPEADARAAGTIAAGLPVPPIDLDDPVAAPPPAAAGEPAAPYLRIAADLRAAITCGALRPGDQLPPIKELAARYNVALSTAHRAIAALASAGEVNATRGRRASVEEPAMRHGIA
jgi:hypothetical protein